MIDDDVKQQLKNLDTRLAKVEQFLPSVATKEDLSASRRELEEVLVTLATKKDLEGFATKADLERFATKTDLEATRREFAAVVETLATREDVRAEAAQTRQHFELIAESLRDEIRIGLEGNIGVTSRVETLERQHGRLERRVTALEAGRARSKK